MKSAGEVGAWGGGVDFQVEWGERSIWTGTFEPIGRWRSGKRLPEGGFSFAQDKGQHTYLTHAPARMTASPQGSFPIPGGEVSLEVDIDIDGPAVSLWIIEFEANEQVARHSWRLDKQRRAVKWTPNPACDSARLSLRVAGPGKVGRLRIRVVDTADDQAMELWRLLNEPKADIDRRASDLLTSRIDVAKGVGPIPVVVPLPRDSADPVAVRRLLADYGLKEDAIQLDSATVDQEVFEHLKLALADRTYSWRCPYSGDAVQSADTFLVSHPSGRPYTFVRFEGAGYAYYLILCPFRGSRIGAYFPQHELVVSRLKLGPVVRVFRALAVRNAASMRRYLQADRPRQLTVPLNTMSHWGHVVLNEFEALQWVFDSGAAENVDIWLKGEVGFVEIERLFPEIAREKLRSAFSAESRFRFCLEESALVVRPQIAFMLLGEKIAHRLVDHCRAEGARLGLAYDVDQRLAGHFPIIWCELRTNDRMWLNQLEGLRAVVKRLKAEFPQLAVVLAGWSRMLAPNAGDEKMIGREEKVAARLAEALGDTPCFAISGVTTKEKMLWTLACDLHISIFGSGILFPLLAELPGVTLCSRHYQENEIFLGDPDRQVHFMQGDDKLSVLPAQHIYDDMDESNGEVRGFSADPEALAQLVREQAILLGDRTT